MASNTRPCTRFVATTTAMRPSPGRTRRSRSAAACICPPRPASSSSSSPTAGRAPTSAAAQRSRPRPPPGVPAAVATAGSSKAPGRRTPRAARYGAPSRSSPTPHGQRPRTSRLLAASLLFATHDRQTRSRHPTGGPGRGPGLRSWWPHAEHVKRRPSRHDPPALTTRSVGRRARARPASRRQPARRPARDQRAVALDDLQRLLAASDRSSWSRLRRGRCGPGKRRRRRGWR